MHAFYDCPPVPNLLREHLQGQRDLNPHGPHDRYLFPAVVTPLSAAITLHWTRRGDWDCLALVAGHNTPLRLDAFTALVALS